jgi:hypothetical protein
VGHATDSQLKQRQLIVDALCAQMGSPCIYIGWPMKPLHEGCTSRIRTGPNS